MAWRPLAAVAPLVSASCGLALLLRPARPPGAALALLAGSFLAWGVTVAWLERRGEQFGQEHREQPGARRAGPWSVPVARAILLGALLVRLPLVFAQPSLSDDMWRYLWDGRVAASGANPYALAPEAGELAGLRHGDGDGLWQRLDHREVPTVYPPLALGAFSIAAAAPNPKLAWKGLLSAVELAGCALLLALARRRGSPPARAAWYAWNPLVALEVAGMGHVDGLAVAPMVAAVLWLTPRRLTPRRDGSRPGPAAGAAGGRVGLSAGLRPGLQPGLAAACAAAGALIKLAPLAALGLWARASHKPWRYLAIALGVSAAGLVPVLLLAGGVPPGLATYGVSWEFNGPLYEPLWRLLDATGADHAATRAADAAKAATGRHDAVNRVYPYLYPQLLAKLLLAAGAAWVVVTATLGRTWSGRAAPPGDDLAGATGRLFGGLLLCSATVYPWYLLWVLPWAALVRHPAWLLASATAPVVYLAAAPGVADTGAGNGAPALFPALWLAAWGPPAVVALWRLVRRHPPQRQGRPA